MDDMIKKLYSLELEEQDRSSYDEELRLEIQKFLEKNQALISVKNENERKGDDLAFAIAELGEETGFIRGFKCAFQLFMECKGK